MEVRQERADGQDLLLVTLTNHAGHNLPSGNAAAPELRLLVHVLGPGQTPAPEPDGAEPPEPGRLLGERVYRLQNLMRGGIETFDVTVAATEGYNTQLKTRERREERFVLPPSLLQAAPGEPLPRLRVHLQFSYRRPYDRAVRWSSSLRTVANHLAFERVALSGLLRVLVRPDTYALLWEAVNQPSTTPMPLHTQTIQLERAPPGSP